MDNPYQADNDRNSVGGHSPAEAVSRRVTVWEGALVPKICCRCGIANKRIEKIARYENLSPDEVKKKSWLFRGIGASLLCGLPGLIVMAVGENFSNRNADRGAGFVVRMNYCRTCAKTLVLTPLDVDMNHFQMTFEVVPNYLDEFRSLNG